MTPVLEVRDLRVVFTQYESGLRRRRLEVVSGIDLTVDAKQLVAVVGSSGSGKSLLAHAVLGVLPRNATVSGQILYQGEVLERPACAPFGAGRSASSRRRSPRSTRS